MSIRRSTPSSIPVRLDQHLASNSSMAARTRRPIPELKRILMFKWVLLAQYSALFTYTFTAVRWGNLKSNPDDILFDRWISALQTGFEYAYEYERGKYTLIK